MGGLGVLAFLFARGWAKADGSLLVPSSPGQRLGTAGRAQEDEAISGGVPPTMLLVSGLSMHWLAG